MRVATWNTKWVASVHRAAITDTLLSTNADVIVGTEILDDLLPSYEHVVDAGTDWGYEVDDARRRKVAMWSRNPWSDVTTLDDTAPGGRLVAATTDAGDGPVRVIGVCIPWDRAHVHTGSKDRQRWDDHEAFLAALGARAGSLDSRALRAAMEGVTFNTARGTTTIRDGHAVGPTYLARADGVRFEPIVAF